MQPITLSMNNVNIQLVNKIKYLGIILDGKLTFRAHFDYIAGKASKLLTALATTTRPTWGLNANILTIIQSVAKLAPQRGGSREYAKALSYVGNRYHCR
mgnify:CR=1 FL=1